MLLSVDCGDCRALTDGGKDESRFVLIILFRLMNVHEGNGLNRLSQTHLIGENATSNLSLDFLLIEHPRDTQNLCRGQESINYSLGQRFFCIKTRHT